MRYPGHFVRTGIGAEPQQARKTHPIRISGSGVFRVCGYTCLACQLRMWIYKDIACQF